MVIAYLNRATRIWRNVHKSVAFVCWFHMFGFIGHQCQAEQGQIFNQLKNSNLDWGKNSPTENEQHYVVEY
jgi:hypothetical protein